MRSGLFPLEIHSFLQLPIGGQMTELRGMWQGGTTDYRGRGHRCSYKNDKLIVIVVVVVVVIFFYCHPCSDGASPT